MIPSGSDRCVLDVETTTHLTGHPFNKQNYMVVAGVMWSNADWQDLGHHFFYNWEELKQALSNVKIILGSNLKFDLHWLNNVGIFPTATYRDCQLAEFLLLNQTQVMPSLNDMALKYLQESKIDVIKTEYWDKGIDTPDIPKDILEQYLWKDLDLTLRVFKKQEKLLTKENKWNLYKLQCHDLGVLQEIEYNGILYDKKESQLRASELSDKIGELKASIASHTTCPNFNCSSGDHLSCLLYGGTIIDTVRFPVGVYKTGQKIGQTRYKLVDYEYNHPRLFEPIKGTELKKEGYWSTEESKMKSLKTKSKEHKKLIANILELSKMEKLKSTYYEGIPKIMETMGWHDDYLHGQFNQTVTITGRLSSSKPNMQNFDPMAKQLCISRYVT